jgi:hypothetical protein
MSEFMDEFHEAVSQDPEKAAAMVHRLPQEWQALPHHEKERARGALQRLKDWLHEPPAHQHASDLSVIISSLD